MVLERDEGIAEGKIYLVEEIEVDNVDEKGIVFGRAYLVLEEEVL